MKRYKLTLKCWKCEKRLRLTTLHIVKCEDVTIYLCSKCIRKFRKGKLTELKSFKEVEKPEDH